MNVYRYPDRKQPYTALGAWRLPCCGCGAPHSDMQTRCCADGSYRPTCRECHDRFVGEMLALLGIPHDPPGRRRPYAEYGLYRTPCVGCGARSSRYDWRIGRGRRAVCSNCDLRLNELALKQIRHPYAAALLTAYRARVEAERHDIPTTALRRRR